MHMGILALVVAISAQIRGQILRALRGGNAKSGDFHSSIALLRGFQSNEYGLEFPRFIELVVVGDREHPGGLFPTEGAQ